MPFKATHSIQQVRTAYIVTACGGLLFTLDLPLLRLSLTDQWTMVFARGILLFLAISAIWFVARKRGDDTPFIAGGAGLLVAFTSALGNIAYINAIVYTSAANVVFIIALTPIIATAISRIVLGEKAHALTWTATCLAFAGVCIIAWDGILTAKPWGTLLALISAFCSACAFTVVRATGRKVATSLAIGSLASAFVAAAFFGVSLGSLTNPGGIGVPAWVWLVLNGLVAIPLATILLAKGPRYLPTSDVSMFFLLETVLTPVWVWLIFREVPSPAVLAGGAIVIVTLIAHSFWKLGWTANGSGRAPVRREH
jgi:drug/metabolite transporter (DMT)-like permease